MAGALIADQPTWGTGIGGSVGVGSIGGIGGWGGTGTGVGDGSVGPGGVGGIGGGVGIGFGSVMSVRTRHECRPFVRDTCSAAKT